MSGRIASRHHELSAKVLLCRQMVVSCATERQIRCVVRAALGEGLEVVQFQVARLGAALAPRVHVAAPPAVAFVYLASQSRWNVSTALSLGTGSGAHLRSFGNELGSAAF
jgi:hypothetical protein